MEVINKKERDDTYTSSKTVNSKKYWQMKLKNSMKERKKKRRKERQKEREKGRQNERNKD